MTFLSSDDGLYLYKYLKRPSMEYWCHVRAGCSSFYLDMLDKLQKWAVGASLAASLEPLVHHQNVTSLNLFCRCYFSKFSSELAQLVPLPCS